MTIYTGKEAVCGIQLTIDRVWRYAMTSEDTLTVKVSDSEGGVISLDLTKAAQDPEDKFVTVTFPPALTSQLALGKGLLTAYLNELVVVPPQKITIKGAI